MDFRHFPGVIYSLFSLPSLLPTLPLVPPAQLLACCYFAGIWDYFMEKPGGCSLGTFPPGKIQEWNSQGASLGGVWEVLGWDLPRGGVFCGGIFQDFRVFSRMAGITWILAAGWTGLVWRSFIASAALLIVAFITAN